MALGVPKHGAKAAEGRISISICSAKSATTSGIAAPALVLLYIELQPPPRHSDAPRQQRREMPLYGAVVVGPPGAGKSTFCAGLCRYLSLAEPPCALINLDPACEGEGLTKFAIDVRDFVSVDAVMKEQHLGPNARSGGTASQQLCEV